MSIIRNPVDFQSSNDNGVVNGSFATNYDQNAGSGFSRFLKNLLLFILIVSFLVATFVLLTSGNDIVTSSDVNNVSSSIQTIFWQAVNK